MNVVNTVWYNFDYEKKLIIFVIIGVITIVILYFAGTFNFSGSTKVDAQTNMYSDRLNGYSFLYPSSFGFTQDFGGMTKISNSVGGIQLTFAFMNSDYVDMCTSQEKFISKPLNIPGQTYSKEIRNQDVVYKYFEINNPSDTSYFANYSIVHGNRCVSISERNPSHDFSVLDSILDSITFK